jgi:hypothetical protein
MKKSRLPKVKTSRPLKKAPARKSVKAVPEASGTEIETLEQLLKERPQVLTSLKNAINSKICCISIFTMNSPLRVDCQLHPFNWPDKEWPSVVAALKAGVDDRLDKLAKQLPRSK